MLIPAVAVALVAVLAGAALVLDRLWLDTALTELRTGAEAAALAAGRSLASDDLLRKDSDPNARLMKARFAASRIAQHNVAAGDPLWLNIDPDGDVRFGKLATDNVTGEPLFLETDSQPTTVAVSARRVQDRQNAVSLPIQSILGKSSADVVAVAEVTLENQIVGLRTIGNLPVPTLPLAVLYDSIPQAVATAKSPVAQGKPQSKANQSTASLPTWKRDIEDRRGQDRFAFDAADNTVSEESDGIPEIVLRTSSTKLSPQQTNAFLLSLSRDLTNDDLQRQVREGWSANDLEPFGGQLLFDHGFLTLSGLKGTDSGSASESLQSVIGQPRVCLLYERVEGDERSATANVRCIGLVAGRVMSVRGLSDSVCEIVLQPTVMTCRSAVVASELTGSTHETSNELSQFPKNPYLYKLRLTN